MNIFDMIAPNRVRFGVRKPGRTYARDLRLSIGDQIIPYDIESQHFLLAGATGSGKTVALDGITDVLNVRPKDRLVVLDADGSQLTKIGRPGDAVANIFDARAVAWGGLTVEIENETDPARIAKGTIPVNPNSSAEEWDGYSRTLLEAALVAMPHASPQQLYKLLFMEDFSSLAKLAASTPASRIFEPGNGKMARSVVGVLSSRLAWLRYLRDPPAGKKPFSFTRWAREAPPGSRLFLTYLVDQMDALLPMYSLAISLLSSSLLSQPPLPFPITAASYRRTWIIMDEWGLMGRISGMRELLSNGRRFGVANICCTQDIESILYAYGQHVTGSLLNGLGTQLIMSMNAGASAEYFSQLLGDHQVRRTLSGSSQGLSGGKKSINNSTSEQVTIERLVLPGEIKNHKNRTGFLYVKEDPILHEVTLPVVKWRMDGQPAFIPRPAAPLPPSSIAQKDEGDDGRPSRPPIDLE